MLFDMSLTVPSSLVATGRLRPSPRCASIITKRTKSLLALVKRPRSHTYSLWEYLHVLLSLHALNHHHTLHSITAPSRSITLQGVSTTQFRSGLGQLPMARCAPSSLCVSIMMRRIMCHHQNHQSRHHHRQPSCSIIIIRTNRHHHRRPAASRRG